MKREYLRHGVMVLWRYFTSCVGCNVNAAGFEQKTALHYAAARGLDPSKLLAAGADPRARDAADNTPLHAAAAGGHGSIVRALVSCSDLSATNGLGRTALHLSAAKGVLRIFCKLYGPGWTPLSVGHYRPPTLPTPPPPSAESNK